MKEAICWISIIFSLCGCARYLDSSYSDILETEAALVKNCSKLGVVTETADADDPFPWVATRRMIFRIKERAVQLGGTHIVWDHKTATSATAEVYDCPAP